MDDLAKGAVLRVVPLERRVPGWVGDPGPRFAVEARLDGRVLMSRTVGPRDLAMALGHANATVFAALTRRATEAFGAALLAELRADLGGEE